MCAPLRRHRRRAFPGCPSSAPAGADGTFRRPDRGSPLLFAKRSGRRLEVIVLHRLKGEPLVFNHDLIESIEALPDTVITLVDGRKVMVIESPPEIVERVREFRASILLKARAMSGATDGPRLRLIEDEG